MYLFAKKVCRKGISFFKCVWKRKGCSMEEKTNVMRILDKKKVAYQCHTYDSEEAVAGMEVAKLLGQDPKAVFKTLVTVGKSMEHYVFMVPVDKELDLKKAAKHVGEKKIEMIKSRDLLPLTGYVHGGCSPVGMKKSFQTTIDESALAQEKIFFSGGKIGCQIETTLEGLQKIVRVGTGDICVD